MHKEKSYRYFKVYVGFRLQMFCPMLTKAASECFEQVSKFRKDDDGVYYCVIRTCEYESPEDVLKQLWDFGAVHVEGMPPVNYISVVM